MYEDTLPCRTHPPPRYPSKSAPLKQGLKHSPRCEKRFLPSFCDYGKICRMEKNKIGAVSAIGYWDGDGQTNDVYNIFCAKETSSGIFFGAIQLKNQEQREMEKTYGKMPEVDPIVGISTRLCISGVIDHLYPHFLRAIGETYRRLRAASYPEIEGDYLGHKTRIALDFNVDFWMQISARALDTGLSGRKLGVLLSKKQDETQIALPLVKAIQKEVSAGHGARLDWDSFSTDIAVPSQRQSFYLLAMASICPEIALAILPSKTV